MRVLRGTVTAVDTAGRRVIVDGRAIAYDTLVLATGAMHGYFGHEQWAVYAPGLKSVADATSIRSRILDAFEKAEATEDAALQRKLLTFLICGAGPTGVEMAGAIAELAHNGMAKDFRNFAKDGTHVASVGGTWMAIVYGMAGLRDHGGRISFNPTRIAKDLRFKLTVRGCRLMVEIRDDTVTYRLEQGDQFTFWHREEEIMLTIGQLQRRDL
jgi:hypothetical protein